METTTLFFEKILGIKAPWFIRDVKHDKKLNRVDLHIEHFKGIQFACPICGKYCSVYDHTTERRFRHLNIFDMETYICIRIPRIECNEDGIKQIDHEIAESNGTVTYAFERVVIDFEHECTFESIGRLLHVDWHLCQKIQERAVKRGQERKGVHLPRRIGVDEKAFAKGHKYETIVHDIDAGVVEDVIDNREESSLESYYKKFSIEERKKVETITMDMWDPYISATKKYIPEAEGKIVFDRFHATKYVNNAVDTIRKAENAQLKANGSDILKGSRYLWLWNEENIPEFRRSDFNELKVLDLKVCRAHAIKENFRNIWEYKSEKWMRQYFDKWYFWATHSKLPAMIKAAKTIKSHLPNILTYAKHQVTNAMAESLNSKIERVKRLACGFRNREHYRIAIFFHCGGLDLYPKRKNCICQILTA